MGPDWKQLYAPLAILSVHVLNYNNKFRSSSPLRNGHLWTPLHQAADKGYAGIISLLIHADAALETKDKSSVSASLGCVTRLVTVY